MVNYWQNIAISIPAPARGATKAYILADVRYQFQFPPLREGRQETGQPLRVHGIFQFPPLREGRLWASRKVSKAFSISIPAPARGATAEFSSFMAGIIFQFPPLREGRQQI